MSPRPDSYYIQTHARQYIEVLQDRLENIVCPYLGTLARTDDIIDVVQLFDFAGSNKLADGERDK